MTETALENPKLPATAEDEGVVVYLARTDALQARIAQALQREPRVIYFAYDCGADDLPIDNLDARAAHGRCRFEQPYEDLWGDRRCYRSEVVVDPTWLQVACLADAMLRVTGDHNLLFEAIHLVRREGEVAIYRFSMGS